MSKVLIVTIIIFIILMSILFNRTSPDSVHETITTKKKKRTKESKISRIVTTYQPELINIDTRVLNLDEVLPDIEIISTPRFLEKYVESYKYFCEYMIKRYEDVKGSLSDIKKAGPAILNNEITSINADREEWKIRLSQFNKEQASSNIEKALYSTTAGLVHIQETRKSLADKLGEMFVSFVEYPATFCSFGNNILLMGPSGVGKTTSALIITEFFYNIGITIKQEMQCIDPSEIGSVYKDGDVQNIRQAYLKSLGGVLFADEIYCFAGEKRFGRYDRGSAVASLLTWTTKLEGITYTIGAGYKEQIEGILFDSNPGVKRRFNHIIELEPPDNRTLTKILCDLLSSTYNITFDKHQSSVVYTALTNAKQNYPHKFECAGGDVANIAQYFSRCIRGKTWNENKTQDERIINTMFDMYVRE